MKTKVRWGPPMPTSINMQTRVSRFSIYSPLRVALDRARKEGRKGGKLIKESSCLCNLGLGFHS
jgi:hypothetical protein